MEYIPGFCGCIATYQGEVEHCPLHNAAPALLKALTHLLIEGPKSVKSLGNLVDPTTYSASLTEARKVIATATGDDLGR